MKGLIEINPCKKSDLSLKNDYPTAGWLNQSHFNFMAKGLPKINAVKSAGEYRVDGELWLRLSRGILVGGHQLDFSYEVTR